MLVLSRFPDESVVVGEDVIITVIEVKGDKVSLGITAPDDVRVDRVEVRIAKDRDRERTAGGGDGPGQ